MFSEDNREINLDWTPKLYRWLEDSAKIHLSTRWMLLVAIASSSIQEDIRKSLKENLTRFHAKENLFHESDVQKYWNTIHQQITFDDIEKILWEDPARKNKHHIVPTNKKRGFQTYHWKVAYTKSMKWRLESFGEIFSWYKMYTRNQQWKMFTGTIKWSDNTKNIYEMGMDRHTYWLNARYGWNAFTQIQMLLEWYGESASYRDMLYTECKELDEIERIIHLSLSDFHDPDCIDIWTKRR